MAASLSYAQLMGLWIRAGGSTATAAVAAAIAEAESGGNPDALNPTDNNGAQSSYGLGQISNGTHVPPAANWADPAVNAQLAVAKYQAAGGFWPWGTYTSGAYKIEMQGSTTPDMNVPANPGAINAQLTAASSGNTPNCAWAIGWAGVGVPVIGHVGSAEICVLSKSQVRAMYGAALVGAGGLLVLAGMAFLGWQTTAGHAVVSVITRGAVQPKPSAAAQRRAERAAEREQAAQIPDRTDLRSSRSGEV
jgi:hypothetical protein